MKIIIFLLALFCVLILQDGRIVFAGPPQPEEVQAIKDYAAESVSPIAINFVTPKHLSKVYATTSVKIEVAASGNALQYQFLIDGQIKQDWSINKVYLWNCSESDIGKTHLIVAKVKNTLGQMGTVQAKVFLVHKPLNPPVRQTSSKY